MMALYLHLTLSFDLENFFAADGLLPPAVVEQWSGEFADGAIRALPPLNQFSYLNYTTTPGELWAAHLISLAVLVLFTIGFQTRIMSIAALYVTLSSIHRAPMLASQVEPVLAMVMFYLCLGPCGARLSVDRLLAQRKAAKNPDLTRRGPIGAREVPKSSWATLAVRLVQVHLCAMYVMMALAKLTGGSSGPVWWSGEAMWWIIARPESRMVDFTFLAGAPALIDLWTYAVVLFELTFPLLVWNRLARPLLLAVAVVMWGSLALATGLTTYCLMMLAANMAFVPPTALAGCCSRSQSESPAKQTVTAAT